jgi:hypothetical protein
MVTEIFIDMWAVSMGSVGERLSQAAVLRGHMAQANLRPNTVRSSGRRYMARLYLALS